LATFEHLANIDVGAKLGGKVQKHFRSRAEPNGISIPVTIIGAPLDVDPGSQNSPVAAAAALKTAWANPAGPLKTHLESSGWNGDALPAASVKGEEKPPAEKPAEEKTDAKKTDAKPAAKPPADAVVATEKTDAKKTDAKETTDAKKTEDKKTDAKETDAKEKTDATKTDAKKTDAKEKTDAEKTDAKKTDAEKTDEKKTDAKDSDAKKTDAEKTDATKETAEPKKEETPKVAVAPPPPIKADKDAAKTTPPPTQAPPGQPTAAEPPEIKTLAPPPKVAEYHEVGGEEVPCVDGACVDTESGPAVFVPEPKDESKDPESTKFMFSQILEDVKGAPKFTQMIQKMARIAKIS